MSETLFAWKRLSDGVICQTATATSAEALFEASGFGAVNTDQPIKGMLAVRVTRQGDSLVEVLEKPKADWPDTRIANLLARQGRSPDYIRSYVRKWNEVKHKNACS